MSKLQRGLDEVDRKVEALKKNFEKTTTEAAKLRVDLEKAEETIKAAELLVGKLDVEFDRWNNQVSHLLLFIKISSFFLFVI